MKCLAVFLAAFLSLITYSQARSLGNAISLETRNKARVIRVRRGQQIQDAINAAAPGDQIVVEAGTYREQLLIQKDRISLIGDNAVIKPPKNADDNFCTGLAGDKTQVGICVVGRDVELEPFLLEHRRVRSAGNPVEGVSITGFHVRDFVGCNIAVVGAKKTQVTKNKLSDGPLYGFLTDGSIDTHFSENVVASTDLGLIGACMDDFRGPQISNNHVSGYQYGYCVQTSGAEVRDNVAQNNCIGVFVDPAIRGAIISGNYIGPSNPKCTGRPDIFGVYGIVLDSAIDTRVEGNTVEGQRNDGAAAGIAIIDEKCEAPALSCFILDRPIPPASGNVVVKNILRDNDVDILLDTAGRNTVKNNKYSTSKPAKLPKEG